MDIDKQQREYFLHQQMKTIQDELGGNPTDEEIKELEELAETKEWNGMSGKFSTKELNKLKRLNPSSPDYSVTIQLFEGNAGPALESPRRTTWIWNMHARYWMPIISDWRK